MFSMGNVISQLEAPFSLPSSLHFRWKDLMQSRCLSSKQSSSLHLHTLVNVQFLRVGCGEGGCNSLRVTMVDGRTPCGIHDTQTS